ncbi:MAG: HlyD family efflux transporter periplasmic adaptor subunit [Gammaproteobacteria bacterium]|nr:HlyD family efflux transporter periplasmic adaptor subunit [Pseudomonadales bacterium]MCP5346872.1 HlyD family efflux transporter periplasmic adaptor subunit [Pseudomonadales bacterium]
MNLDRDLVLTRIAERLPEGLRLQMQSLRDRFMAARKPTRYAIVGGSAGLLILLFSLGGGSGTDGAGSITFQARRGDLDITVLEGGALEALVSTEIRSAVKGREGVKILSIIEEGYRITEEDVSIGKVLVELDTSQLIDEQLNQEISVESAEAEFIERRAQYEIQLNQNTTELNDARQTMRFARLDFEKFLGANVVNEIIAELEIEERLARAEAADLAVLKGDVEQAAETMAAESSPTPAPRTGGFDLNNLDSLPPQFQERIRQAMAENDGQLPQEMLDRMQRFSQGGFQGGGGRNGGNGNGRPTRPTEVTSSFPTETGAAPAAQPRELVLANTEKSAVPVVSTLLLDEEYMNIRDQLDFTQYANIDRLEDGEAKQMLRQLQDELQVAQEEYLLAQTRIEGQRRLESRGFITPTELEAEELNLNKANNKLQEKETSLKLYIQYTFPKEAEQKLTDYENAVMSYQRQLKENIAEEAQEEARLSSAERKFNLERVKLADVNQQIEAATIRAIRPGLVVYGASDQNSQRFRRGNEEAIAEGATVRERQSILTIPDMREMAVKVNIHESAVQRVAVGQQVNVSIDAFPDERLTGVVTKVAVVADSANAFMNPDLKVYPTTIKIDGTHEWLRPGMSAQVEILVNRLEDVVYVPLQAVSYYGDQRVVYVRSGGRPARRDVTTGAFSEQFIEIVSGIREGEEVLLLPPQQELVEAAI